MKKFQLFLIVMLFALPLSIFAQPTFTVTSTSTACDGPDFTVSLDVANFTDMISWQFALEWDSDLYELVNVNNPNVLSNILVNSNRVDDTGLDSLVLSWFSAGGGTTVADNSILNFTFQTTGQAANTSNFNFIPIPPSFPIEVAYFSGGIFVTSPFTLNTGMITVTDTQNPTISCPGNITMDTNGSSSTQITGGGFTANDNCNIDFVSYNLTGVTSGVGTGDVSNNINFNVGTTTVEYTVNDTGGNTATCSYDVIVTNNNAPTVLTVNMDNLNINCEANTASINVYADNFTDIRGAQFNISWSNSFLQYVDTSNIVFTSGFTTFGTSNLSNGQLSFSWGDVTPLTLPNGTILFTINFTLNAPAGITIPVPFFNNPSIPTEFTSATSFPFPLAASEYQLNNGSILIFDNEAPTISCPANVTASSVNGTDAIVNMIAPTANDNCGILDTTYTLTDAATSNNIGSGTGDASGTAFPVGTTVVEYTVSDFDGNATSCNFNVTITDDAPGILTFYMDELNLDCGTNMASINVYADNFIDIRGAQFNINWSNFFLQYVDTSNIVFTSGFTTFGTSNLTNGQLSFSWGDGTPLTLQNGTVLFTINFSLNVPPGVTIPIQFFNNPSIPTEVTSATSFPFPLASSEYELIDGSIFISDNEPPTISCPANVTVTSSNGMDAMVSGIGSTSSDNCGILDTTYTLTDAATSINIGSGTSDASGTNFPIGTTIVEYTVTDLDGNSTSCDFNVTVIEPETYILNIDSIEVDCNATTSPASVGISVQNFTNVTGFQFTIEWDETKLEYSNVIENITPTGIVGTTMVNNGILTYSWFGPATTFMDGLEVIEIQFVILDNTAGNDYDIEFVTVGAPTPLDIVVQNSGQLPGSLPASQTEFINGNLEITDSSPPTLSCPMDVTVSTNGMSSMVVSNIAPTAFDDCGIPVVNYTIATTPPVTGMDDASGNSFPAGVTMVTYTATDAGGNTVSCNFNVTVIQDPLMISCPSNVIQDADADVCNADIASLPVTITSDPMNVATTTYELVGPNGFDMGTGNVPAMTYDVGTTTIVYTVTDIFGAIEKCTLTVVINDVQPPVFSNVGQNMTVECDAIPDPVLPIATDNCDGNVNVVYNGETLLNGGATRIRVWTVTDAAGNSANTSQTIIVQDTSPPVLTCPTDVTVDAISSTLNVCGNNVTWSPVVAVDNCDNNVQITSTHNSGGFFQIGTTIVTSYAIDDDGNIDSCKFNVTVLDAEAPSIVNCPTDTTVFVLAGSDCSRSVLWDEPSATDNCDNNVTLTSMPTSGSNFSVGTTPVIYTATDASGNTTVCSFNVTVIDEINPGIACPADITVSTNGDTNDPNNFITNALPLGCDSVILTFGFPLAADNCGVPTITQSGGLISGSTYGTGTHIIEFVATDGAGNTDTCETTISVVGFIDITVTADPVTICLDGTTTLSTDFPTADHTWTAPDGTTYDTPEVIISNATLADSGTYTVIVTDPNSNCTSAEVSVDLVVLQGPDISIVANSLNCTNGTIDIPLNGIDNGTIDIVSWAWTNPDNEVFSMDQSTIIPQAQESDSGIYCLTATSSNGCSTQVCDTITITDNLLTMPTVNSTCNGFVCVGETCSLAGFFSDPDIDSVAWTVDNPNGGLSVSPNNPNQASITPTQNGVYVYTFTIFSDGCSSSTNVPLQVSSPASVFEDLIEVDFNGSTIFNVTDNDIIPGSLPGTFSINITNDVDHGLLINNGDGNVTYTPDESYFGTDQFIYEICLDCNNETICRWAIATINVTTEECLIPTVITPNDDGMNDAVEITCVDQNPENELVVYNRWGDEVYRASPYNNDWKGTYNDQPLPDGTYFYVFLRNATDTDPQKGSLTIMR